MSTSGDLKDIFAAGQPLVDQWLDIAEQFAALGRVARERGLDWGQIKALLKAQAQDARDERGGNKRIEKIIEKADYASSYADMLGLGNMNKKNFSEELAAGPSGGPHVTDPANPYAIPPDLSIPPFLKREPATTN